MSRMPEFYCEYYTKDGKRVGESIHAYTGIDARRIIEQRPDFSRHANYPEKISD